MKTNGKKAFGGLLCRLNERCNLCNAHEKKLHSSVLNKGIKVRPSSKRVGINKKSPNKSGYILRSSAGNWCNTARRGPTAVCCSARNAGRKTTERHAHKAIALKSNDRMKQVAVQWLQVDKWSPELISVRGNETGLCPVSHECLYQWIWACKHGNKRAHQPFKRLYQDLRHGHRRRKRGLRRDSRGVITGRVSIENRPAIVQSRKRIGDIEVDLMMGKKHQGALLVMTDRATLHTHLHKLPNKKSHTVSQSIRRILHKATYPLHTLTFDNDKAFAGHQAIGLALGLET